LRQFFEMSLNKQLLTQKKHNFGKMKKNIVVRLPFTFFINGPSQNFLLGRVKGFALFSVDITVTITRTV